ncbi:hypothetical protein [Corynebacterium amycolatum]|uniref:Uncharacterized protein n=1 Tax=Komagataella phaffii TaxID=460519 RepID=A0A2R4PI94_9ASCO|nr:hypothetical protein [Corynebacterium amycolatum]AVX51680.1 hypothetical protein [Komagataella phaffii]MCQ9168417.1 hypothetical protein [Corynebacterium amycolatum]
MKVYRVDNDFIIDTNADLEYIDSEVVHIENEPYLIIKNNKFTVVGGKFHAVFNKHSIGEVLNNMIDFYQEFNLHSSLEINHKDICF